VPGDGANVEVESGWNMSYDLSGDSPAYEMIWVNGLLWFADGEDRVLRAKHIFVRAGELHIGTKEQPF